MKKLIEKKSYRFFPYKLYNFFESFHLSVNEPTYFQSTPNYNNTYFIEGLCTEKISRTSFEACSCVFHSSSSSSSRVNEHCGLVAWKTE